MKSSIRSLVACLGACAALVSTSAQAEGFYAELGYAWIQISGGGISATPADALLRVGYNVTPYLGVEVAGGTSASSANVRGASIKVDSAYGVYLKGQYEVAPSLELFAKLGWIDSTLKVSGGGFSASTSDNSFSYAVGVQYLFDKNWYVQADYASYYDKSGVTGRGPSISGGYRF